MSEELAGYLVVVTGASSGIGAATARALAGRGAALALVGRDPRRLTATGRDVATAGAAAVSTYPVDFASLDAVRSLAEALLADHPRLDVLVNNAGLATRTRTTTVDGYETTFAVNHLAPYLLTRLLWPGLAASAPARVIIVSSSAHRHARLYLDDPMSPRDWRPMRAYAASKLAGMLFTVELARRGAGHGVVAHAVHPGVVRTRLGRDSRATRLLTASVGRWWFRSPEDGARPVVYLVSAPEAGRSTGGYWVDCAPAEPAPAARDLQAAARLWDVSADLVGLPRDDPPPYE